MSQTTKRALAASLKKLLSQKPLDKITVVDIAEDCGVNRQTFYYHFQDIYDLTEWLFTSETTAVLGEKKTYGTWQQGFLQIFEYVLENKTFILHTYHSVSREFLEHYLYEVTYSLLYGVLEEMAEKIPVREEDKAFIAHFYKYAFVGLVLEWIGTGMKENPETILKRLECLLHGSFFDALARFRTGRQQA